MKDELERLLENINQHIEFIRKEAERAGVYMTEMRYPNGDLIMTQVFAAKAQVLHSLVLLEQNDIPKVGVVQFDKTTFCDHEGLYFPSEEFQMTHKWGIVHVPDDGTFRHRPNGFNIEKEI